MGDQLEDGKAEAPDQQRPVDPPRRPPLDPAMERARNKRIVFVPAEGVTADGRHVFRTHDNAVYVRDSEFGTMRRMIPKVRGKSARRADKAARRKGVGRGA